jgi:hypothetical protein
LTSNNCSCPPGPNSLLPLTVTKTFPAIPIKEIDEVEGEAGNAVLVLVLGTGDPRGAVLEIGDLKGRAEGLDGRIAEDGIPIEANVRIGNEMVPDPEPLVSWLRFPRLK